MVKVGIMSMQRIYNYGSFLQAYGLRKILEELGCKVEFVDYHVGDCLVKSDGGGIERKFTKAMEVFKCHAPLKDKLSFIKYKNNYSKNHYPILGISQDMNYLPELDLLVIGSDEVFNCIQDNTNVGFSPELFGANNRAKRLISYAASCGNTTLEKLDAFGVKNEVSGWIKAFDALSVRDANTGKVVRAFSVMEPEYHLDPVLVYDFITKEKIPDMVDEKGYMVLYGYTGRFSVDECEAIRCYAKKKKLKILCIGGVQHCCDRFVDCSPMEVIAYFQNADAVVTDTFHGSILSIITHRNFAAFIRDTGYGNTQKLMDLLKRLRLESCIVSDINEFANILGKKTMYNDTDSIIAKERKRTYDYLGREIELCSKR